MSQINQRYIIMHVLLNLKILMHGVLTKKTLRNHATILCSDAKKDIYMIRSTHVVETPRYVECFQELAPTESSWINRWCRDW